ncbi:MAG TPA: beta-propeller fold lactonase family protein [Verrucomicrobiae bacterium]|nr:beta-propeller fold lactonase family protein [Verrucomicrobiae bacterium]
MTCRFGRFAECFVMMKRRLFVCSRTIAFIVSIFFAQQTFADDFDATAKTVGHNTNGLETPVNQLVTPAGIQVELPRVRPNALALSPNGKILVTAGLTHELIVVDPASGNILRRVSFPSDAAAEEKPIVEGILNPDEKAQLSFTGLTFSPDGSRIYLSNVNGDIKVFTVGKTNNVSPLFSIALPTVKALDRTNEIPAGITVSRDGKKIYVAGNLSNRLFELDAATGKILRTWNVGVAPFDVVLCKNKVYASNWGGRQPDADSLTGPAGQGVKVRVDERSIASEGSVSVIDLDGTNQTEIVTGLHACALALSPDKKFLVCANAGSDTLSVIDTRTDKIADTICARENEADLFGAQPNALAFDKSGRKLYVCNGTQNAVAVFQFKTEDKFLGLIPIYHFHPGQPKLLGLIPVGWFSGGIAFDARDKKICVANIKDISTNEEKPRRGLGNGLGFNTREYAGSLSLVPIPSLKELEQFTQTALADLRYPLLAQAKLPPRENQIPVPVPERVGEPSVFSHVIYIIKENRSYDQVLGDATNGNGNADLCIFGERVTPNQHKITRDFCLLDNTYCCSILSADGHNWTDSGIATDYLEREFAGWPRSYPAGGFGLGGEDALAYSPAGFIWNDALAHGKTVADFGEFTTDTKHWKDSARKDKINFLDAYHDFIGGSNEIVYSSEPDIEALRPYVVTNTIGWDLDVPDVWRAAQFIQSLKSYETNDNFPNLIILWLPNDHTSGTKTDSPTPEAQVADNDLAMGQVFEAVSHSKFWTNTCIFTIEDDPQNGWDHVSGYRTTAYVASAYTRRGETIRTQYNQTSLLRTMELILGLPPMNQMDATATPMFDCFTNMPDFTAFDSVTNQVPLDEMNPPPKKIRDAQLRKDAIVSSKLPLEKEDQCPEDVFNRILWRAMKGSQTPYPERAVKVVEDDD